MSLQNSLVNQWIQELRSVEVQQDRMRFRKNLERIGEIAAYEISKRLRYTATLVPTPLGEIEVPVLAQHPVIATILRAGIPLQQGVLNYFDHADCAFIAAYRRHHKDGSFEISQDYMTCPSIQDRPLIITDPMLATGASLKLALSTMSEHGKPEQVHIVAVIACTEGIESIIRRFPDVSIWAGVIDDELTAKGYIVPGLGDAGDLAYGDKRQS